MITTRKFLGLGAAVTIGTLLACANDSTAPAVTDRVFTSLEMTPSAVTFTLLPPFELWNQDRLFVRARDQYGEPMIVGAPSVSISSSDPSVVTVTHGWSWTDEALEDGHVSALVRPVAPGEAVISASWTVGGVTKTVTSIVTVESESTEGWSLKVDPAVLTLHVGSRESVQATVVDETGNTRIQYPPSVAFTRDRNDVVALHPLWEDAFPPPPWSVYVLGVGPGEATVTAEYGGLSATATVIVVP